MQEREYQRHPSWGLPEFHSGEGALRTHSDGGGHTTVCQDVEVRPNTIYLATVWVRAVDLHGKGFGTHSNDSAGLIIQEMNRANQILTTHPKTETKHAGPYTLLSRKITAGPAASRLRFALDTVIDCHYTEGHVTYDDCCLQEVGANSAAP